MNRRSTLQPSFKKLGLALAVGTIAAGVAAPCFAGCGLYYAPATGALARALTNAVGADAQSAKVAESELSPAAENDASAAHGGIVGLWNVTFVSDGGAYPLPIPAGVVTDFGTVQWHGDGTELMVSGGRPPSSGDVCMGAWDKTGPATYKLKHVALAWVSGDTPPPLGPVSPAMFVGPATIREVVTLDRSHNSYAGTFTIDQYASDGTTLLEHVSGTITATRITAN